MRVRSSRGLNADSGQNIRQIISLWIQTKEGVHESKHRATTLYTDMPGQRSRKTATVARSCAARASKQTQVVDRQRASKEATAGVKGEMPPHSTSRLDEIQAQFGQKVSDRSAMLLPNVFVGSSDADSTFWDSASSLLSLKLEFFSYQLKRLAPT